MSDTERIVLPSSPPTIAPSVEARRWIRYPCDLAGFSWPILHPATEELLPTRVLNMSAAGLGLLLHRPLPPGTFLVVQIQDASGESSCMMLTQVVRIVPQIGGRWVLGCSLVGKMIQTAAGSSKEYLPGAGAGNQGRPVCDHADTRGVQLPDQGAVEAFVREQFDLLWKQREALLVEQKATETVNGQRQQELDRQADYLESLQGKLEEREANASKQFEQAIPERLLGYSNHDVATEPFMSNQELLQQLFEQEDYVQRLTQGRDTMTAREREIDEKTERCVLQENEMKVLRLQLECDQRQLKDRQLELHLLEVEMRETVEIAERESRRYRAQINEERMYLARMREALRLERQALRSSPPAPHPALREKGSEHRPAPAEINVLAKRP